MTNKKRLISRLLTAAATATALMAGGLAAAGPASAASLTASNVNLRACVDLGNPVCSKPVGTTGSSGIQKMRCWRDASWATGRYSSNRWFLIVLQDGREGFVHSSFVGDQQTVPNCSELSSVRAADFAISQFSKRTAPSNVVAMYSDWAPGPQGEWSGDCSKFVSASFLLAGVAYVKADAINQYGAYVRAGKVLTPQQSYYPRYGSPVYYRATKWGHTAIYIGGSSIMTTQGLDNDNLEVTVRDLGSFPNYLGWAAL